MADDYPFNLDGWGNAFDYLKGELIREMAETQHEIRVLKKVEDVLVKNLVKQNDEVARLREENAQLKAALENTREQMEELLRRPELEEDEPEDIRDPRTLAEIAREHGWL